MISRTEPAVPVRTLQDCAATPRSGHAGQESRLALVASSATRVVGRFCHARTPWFVRAEPPARSVARHKTPGVSHLRFLTCYSCVKTTSSESRRRIAVANRVSGVCRSATIGHDPRAPPVEHTHVRRTRFRRPWLVASYILTTSGSISQ